MKPKLPNSKGGRLILNPESTQPKSWQIGKDMMKNQETTAPNERGPMLQKLIGFCLWSLLGYPSRDRVFHANEKQ